MLCQERSIFVSQFRRNVNHRELSNFLVLPPLGVLYSEVITYRVTFLLQVNKRIVIFWEI